MAEPIGAAHVALTADSATFLAKMTEAGGSVRRFEQSTTGSLAAARGSMQSFTSSMATSMGSVGKALQGAQAATAAARQGMELLGVKGSAAVGGLGNAISTLLATGFTPWGLAVAGVTAAFSYLAGAQSNAGDETEKLTRKVEKQVDVMRRLVDLRGELDKERGAGPSAQQKSLSELYGLRSDINIEMTSNLARIRKQAGTAEAEATRQRIAELQNERQVVAGLIADFEHLTTAVEKQFRAGKADPTYDGPWPYTPAFDRRAASRYPRGYLLQGAMAGVPTAEPKPTSAEELLRGSTLTMPTLDELSAGFEEDRQARRRADALGAERIEEATQGVQELRAGVLQLDDSLVQLGSTEQRVSDSFREGLGSGLTDAFMSAAHGAESFASAMSRMAESVLADIERIILRELVVNQLVGALSSSLGLAVSPTPRATPMGPVPVVSAAAAAGGSWRVGGSGGTDSKYLGMALTPGELVEVSRPGEERGGGVDVIVNNYSGQQATQKRSRGANGREVIEVTVGQAAAADLDKGGPLSRSLERNYGMRRSPRRG